MFLDTIPTYLTREKNDTTWPILLHPYCRDGYVTTRLAKGLNLLAYGVESDDSLAWKATQALNAVVHGDPSHTVISSHSVSALLLTPGTYHVAPTLSAFLEALRENALLILYLSHDQITKALAGWLSKYSDRLEVYRMYGGSTAALVCLAKVTHHNGTPPPLSVTAIHAQLLAPALPFEPASAKTWTITNGGRNYVQFYNKGLNLSELKEALDHSDVWNNPKLIEQIWPTPQPLPPPLMPLKPGHLALTIAGGALNGQIVRYRNEPILIKGRTTKVTTKIEEEELDQHGNPVLITRTRESFATTIKGFNVKTGKLYTIQ